MMKSVMSISAHPYPFNFGQRQIAVYIPDNEQVKKEYKLQKEKNGNVIFPYWTQVWPAALGLCEFIVRHPVYVQDKIVTELAAGLGLPSLVAAGYARSVACSDYIPEAVELMQRSVELNRLGNVHCSLLDWNELPTDLATDVLLLSDINYDEKDFDQLYKILLRLLQAGTTIILSTPQRLMAKPFIARILSYCTTQQEIQIEQEQKQALITVLVLNNKVEVKSKIEKNTVYGTISSGD